MRTITLADAVRASRRKFARQREAAGLADDAEFCPCCEYKRTCETCVAERATELEHHNDGY